MFFRQFVLPVDVLVQGGPQHLPLRMGVAAEMQHRMRQSPEKWKNLDLRFGQDKGYEGRLGSSTPNLFDFRPFFQMHPPTGYYSLRATSLVVMNRTA